MPTITETLTISGGFTAVNNPRLNGGEGQYGKSSC